VTYELAEQRGRHSDYAPAIALAVDDSRWKGQEPEQDLPEEEREAKRKREFLEERKRERERAKRRGGFGLPITHRGR
jgi:hypothetical protein